MSYIDELRKRVNSLFENATEKEIIEQAAIVSNQIDKIEEEQKTSQENYNKLLKDYKDVVLHSSFKPSQEDLGSDSHADEFDAEKAFNEAFKISND